MVTSTESRLWLAVHLLYPNSSQAFDVYHAVVLQSEEALIKDDRTFVFSKLISIFEKIPPISSKLSFYEFEFEQIDQWKAIYKNSQKTQLFIFIGVLIFELKIGDIAPQVKLSQDKAQFLFHQMFKKLAQNGSKIKYSDQLSFKKQNDLKISYLFTYENLIEYCLGQLTDEESEKVKMGLELYPILQLTRDEYSKIISQIQNLKVKKLNSPVTKSKKKLNLVESDAPAEQPQDSHAFYKNKKIVGVAGVVLIVASISLFQVLVRLGYIRGSEKTVIMQEIAKSSEITIPQAEIALQSLPSADASPASSEVSQAEAAVPVQVAEAKAEGGLFRGSLFVKDLNESNKQLLAKIVSLGAKKAGEVELGWLKSESMAYYHFTIPESNIDEANKYFKKLGSLDIRFEDHPRLIPAGSRRFIIEVKGK